MMEFDNMIQKQNENESFLEAVLDLSINSMPIPQQLAVNEAVILECDENGVFPDDEEDDKIEKKLGV